jgi:hypothetical protein
VSATRVTSTTFRLRCPGCGGDDFAVTVAEYDPPCTGGWLRFACVRCNDFMVVHGKSAPAGSVWGKKIAALRASAGAKDGGDGR